MVDRLAEDHSNAKRLARGLAGMPGVTLDPDAIQTNIVIFEVTSGQAQELMAALKDRGVLSSYADGRRVRLVTHYGILDEDIDETLSVLETVARERNRAAG
jgi:threonine aldolase